MLFRNGNGYVMDEHGKLVILNENCSGGPTLITETGGYYHPCCSQASNRNNQQSEKNQRGNTQSVGGYWGLS